MHAQQSRLWHATGAPRLTRRRHVDHMRTGATRCRWAHTCGSPPGRRFLT